MALRISSKLHGDLLSLAAASPALEICGLLFGSFDRVDAIESVANVAADPARSFEIDPARLIAAHRSAREGGAALLGHFHSHPNGLVQPSARDAEMAAEDGKIWLIVGGELVTAWRAVPGGSLHDRFDPLPILQC